MNIQNALKQEPQHIQDSLVVQAMARFIQHQAEQIQRQVEQISKLENTVEDLKDEIFRLNKTPKRPKFKPNKMVPRTRGRGSSQSKSSKKDKNICAPKKKREEIKVPVEGVPQGSRFKGYSEFRVQDSEITVKEISYKLRYG